MLLKKGKGSLQNRTAEEYEPLGSLPGERHPRLNQDDRSYRHALSGGATLRAPDLTPVRAPRTNIAPGVPQRGALLSIVASRVTTL